MTNSVFPSRFDQRAFRDSASVGSASEPTALRDFDSERHERLPLPPRARLELWAILIALAGFWLVMTWTVQSAW